MARNGSRKLAAEALPPNGARGGTRKGHVWIPRAALPFVCEGLNPLSSGTRRFAASHEHIQVGESFLLKIWRTREGVEFATRHCRWCGKELTPEC